MLLMDGSATPSPRPWQQQQQQQREHHWWRSKNMQIKLAGCHSWRPWPLLLLLPLALLLAP
jgi:hypothetical protein